ncbi:response regulator [Sphingomonas sp. FW199]|uniref:response regulator n=1 Tax=Sphingomonas sp. FW199 TaxID=3400217 RepID=UPI003CF31EA5
MSVSPARILVIEDEPLIAMMIEDFLDLLGHSMAGQADSVDQALAMVDARGFDAAIVDVNLRGGEQSWPVSDALAAANIPFALATGSGGDDIRAEHHGRPILAKPFTLDQVERTLAQLIG